jgi:outer membrane protein OmpA-like peptidoglycan-associated protein
VDGVTGAQSDATQSMGAIIANVARAKYQQRFAVQQFSADAVAAAPLVLVGTFTGLNKEGKPIGQREVFRVCLALADLRTGKIVGKGSARALPSPDGAAPVPLAYFRDSPAWRLDEGVDGYIKTCQGTKAGDPINPAYLDGILVAALVGEAIDAYNAGRFREALDLYQSALQTPAGDQLRVHNGLYLANWKLDRQDEAAQAFGRIVDHGLARNRLVVKLLFKQASTAFWPDPAVSEQYPMWLGQIAQGAVRRGSCLEVTGHTSPTGPAALNERLSLLRAEYVKSRLEAEAPALAGRVIANGVGSRETIVGTGRDDATDALDRRVEFKPLAC